MQRGFLMFAAAVLGTGMAVTPFLGLDGLPRDVRRQIAAERTALAQAQRDLRKAQDEVQRDLQAEPELFKSIPASKEWAGQFNNAVTDLQSASRDMEQLTTLERQNRREDLARATALLSHERTTRTAAAGHAAAIEKDADHWVELKKRLPDEMRQVERDYQALKAVDLGPVSATVQKAQTDWPDKRADLESRLNGLRQTVAKDDELWKQTEAARKQAASGNVAGLDVGALLTAAETIHADVAALPQKSAELQTLTAQLNRSWDKVLVDMETRGSGKDRTYVQKIRTVTVPKDGQATSEEKWVEAPQARFEAMKNDLGMAVEHKPLGKYDIEAERTSQPAGFAYMATPAQQRNQYGYWENRGGSSFWVWYGQYALMRDLFFNHNYRPLDRGQYEDYRSYQSRGQTYYGRDYGTQGQATQERYSGSKYAQSGGFRDSKFASKPGKYKDSEYATPSGSTAPRKFGSGGNSSPAPSYRPAPSRPSSPRPSFSPRPSSPGRRFGRR
jgi:hypothetical protein